jgi:hypothetical protein
MSAGNDLGERCLAVGTMDLPLLTLSLTGGLSRSITSFAPSSLHFFSLTFLHSCLFQEYWALSSLISTWIMGYPGQTLLPIFSVILFFFTLVSSVLSFSGPLMRAHVSCVYFGTWFMYLS